MPSCLQTVAVLMAVAWALPAVVGQPPGAGGPPQPTPGGPATVQPAKPQLTVKVFKLERGDPDAVITALNALLEGPNAEEIPPMRLGVPPGIGAPGGVGGPQPGGFGFAPAGAPPGGFGGAPMGGMLGFGGAPAPSGGGIGCFFGNGEVNVTPVWRATAQARTRAVIVRGSERHVKVASDLVAVLDRPANTPLPKLQIVKAFALKHATAEELTEVIDALSFGDVKMAALDEQLLALVAPDDVVKSVAELVKELDMPGNGEPKAKKGSKPTEIAPPK